MEIWDFFFTRIAFGVGKANYGFEGGICLCVVWRSNSEMDLPLNYV